MAISDVLKTIQGWPFGRVYPPRPAAPLPSTEPRVIALETLGDYFSLLKFRRRGSHSVGAETVEFQVPRQSILIDRAANNKVRRAPSIVFLPGESEYLTAGLTSFLDEDTVDKFGRGTVLQTQYEYRELVVAEVTTEQLPDRRAIMAGLEVALVPTEQMYGIRFTLPRYFDQTVCFTLWSGQRTDDPDAINNWRVGHLMVEMRFDVVSLVNANDLQIASVTEAFEQGDVDFVAEAHENPDPEDQQ